MVPKSRVQPLQLTPQQQDAVHDFERDVLITAGAGSGKTLTLVACYIKLLSQGFTPRQIAAITFTEKAAREMRNRVRNEVSSQAHNAKSQDERLRWEAIEAQMDAARIGTIHSLCAEILRSHPAEAGIDPGFEVIEEGIGATLKARAVDDALAWAAGETLIAPIFLQFTANHLGRILSSMLNRRLDASPLFEDSAALTRGEDKIREALLAYLNNPENVDAIRQLSVMQRAKTLAQDAGETIAARVVELVEEWPDLSTRATANEVFLTARALFAIRRKRLNLQGGKVVSQAKELLRLLQSVYDQQLNPWLGGKKSTDRPPAEEVEQSFRKSLPLLKSLYDYALDAYRQGLDLRYALDFDDLEHKALEILDNAAIREIWQTNLKAILVDEFQDTNHRQQMIVNQLRGAPGGLIVVGDARQSIYRFRGADVTVFRMMQNEMSENDGKMVELDLSFRAHAQLSKLLDDLLQPIFKLEKGALFNIPFTALRSFRKKPRQGVLPPFVEIHTGVAETTDEARPIAARALVGRLIELHQQGQIKEWDEVALLFRASTGFGTYEDELEAAGIPFVTIAGRGFYNRPEVRDVLNMLRALADPLDDLALAGLLRSPAFGLSDSALYKLRWREDLPTPLWGSLRGDLSLLNETDREHAERAAEILEFLIPKVERLPIAVLLSALVNKTDYRSLLAASHSRLLHNLDKLILDAHRSGLVRVRAFLEYIQSLRDVGAREGEAPVEESGAVRLMTIHKAKGLEFPFVVLADAARSPRRNSEVVYLLPDTGVAVIPNRLEGAPLITRYAQHLNQLETDAEEVRLLYVALTRTAEKLLISGHVVQKKKSWQTRGWLKELLEVIGLDLSSPSDEIALSSGEIISYHASTAELVVQPISQQQIEWPISSEKQLYKTLVHGTIGEADPERERDIARDWRATGRGVRAPAIAVGKMVHEAIRRWKFPPDPSLDAYLQAFALREGLVDEGQRRRAVEESKDLLRRFWEDGRRKEIENAKRRYHELPFSRPLPDGKQAIGVIDLLYEDDRGWTLIDFKTDALSNEESLQAILEREHKPQVMRYERAVKQFLQTDARVMVCYLDFQNGVRWVNVR